MVFFCRMEIMKDLLAYILGIVKIAHAYNKFTTAASVVTSQT